LDASKKGRGESFFQVPSKRGFTETAEPIFFAPENPAKKKKGKGKKKPCSPSHWKKRKGRARRRVVDHLILFLCKGEKLRKNRCLEQWRRGSEKRGKKKGEKRREKDPSRGPPPRKKKDTALPMPKGKRGGAGEIT